MNKKEIINSQIPKDGESSNASHQLNTSLAHSPLDNTHLEVVDSINTKRITSLLPLGENNIDQPESFSDLTGWSANSWDFESAKNVLRHKKCINCQKEFIDPTDNINKKYCSIKCRNKIHKIIYAEAIKRWIIANKSKNIERKRIYRELNRIEIRRKAREYQKKNQQKIREKLKSNPNNTIIESIRRRINEAFKLYSTTGKILPNCKYGIDYQSIIKHLGPCPGKREDYHIDHIIPICSFNFNNSEEVKKAFAPENHQWLTKEENLKKNKFIIEVKE